MVLSTVVGFVTWYVKGLWSTYVVSKDLPYRISGRWYSAEYDEKGGEPRNTILEVKIRRRPRGRVVVEVKKALKPEPSVETVWKVIATLVQGDSIVGTWKSTVDYTSRHGVAMLKFIDNGRAIGYWVGPAGPDHPVYGYWVMSRDEDDLKQLATHVLHDTKFKSIDVARYVIESPQPKQKET